jgi:Amt family ammonium transporter
MGAFAVLAYSFIITLILGFLLEKTLGFRVSKEEEMQGIDVVEHLESAYDFEGTLGGTFAGTSSPAKHKVAATKDEEVSA